MPDVLLYVNLLISQIGRIIGRFVHSGHTRTMFKANDTQSLCKLCFNDLESRSTISSFEGSKI
jgi:hypothetical protein